MESVGCCQPCHDIRSPYGDAVSVSYGNFAFSDTDGRNCGAYDRDPSLCGEDNFGQARRFGESTLDSMSMCCRCGGGVVGAAPVPDVSCADPQGQCVLLAFSLRGLSSELPPNYFSDKGRLAVDLLASHYAALSPGVESTLLNGSFNMSSVALSARAPPTVG